MPEVTKLPIQLQSRDLAILRGLFESRLMTLSHIAAIYFEDRWEAAKKRTQKLRAAGLLIERPRKLYQPTILHLTSRALRLLSEGGHLRQYPVRDHINLHKRLAVSDLTLRHELDVLDIKSAVMSAVRKRPHFEVAEFCTWPLLFQFRASRPAGGKMLVRADGFIRIHENTPEGRFEHAFFLEVDRSTEPQETLAQRAVHYREFYKRGGMAVWNGKEPREFESHPFRVLVVLQNEERRNNTAQRLLQCTPPILSQVWLTTRKEMLERAFEAIWVTPRAYRDAIKGTEFADTPARESRIYRRRSERERHVQGHVIKGAMFQSS